jgi:hypothetical protein
MSIFDIVLHIPPAVLGGLIAAVVSYLLAWIED